MSIIGCFFFSFFFWFSLEALCGEERVKGTACQFEFGHHRRGLMLHVYLAVRETMNNIDPLLVMDLLVLMRLAHQQQIPRVT